MSTFTCNYVAISNFFQKFPSKPGCVEEVLKSCHALELATSSGKNTLTPFQKAMVTHT